MTSHLLKNRKSSMQMSYDLYWSSLVDLAYFKESVENAFLVVSSTRKKRHL